MSDGAASPAGAPRLSVVVPALDEAARIGEVLARLQPLRRRGHEVIVVDGGSSDGTPAVAGPLADRVLSSGRGRATQMNVGAAAARGEMIWFLHADTLAPEDADLLIIGASAAHREKACWGRFDVRITGKARLLPVVARAMNLRSCLTGIATGDQGMFVATRSFRAIGGFAPIPLMEDIDLSRRLKRELGQPLCLHAPLVTSGRRWETRGVVRTIVLMWSLRLAYWLGASPQRLARLYR